MAKETNIAKSPLQLFINDGLAEIDNKAKAEKKGSSAYMHVLLASDDEENRRAFKRHLDGLNDADDKVRENARLTFADFIGANALLEISDGKERKTQDYRNLITKQMARINFAVDVHNMGVREFVIITERGVAYIKGGSVLAAKVWNHNKWHSKERVKDKRDENMDIPLVTRASDRDVGSISWSMLADLVASENGRKANANPVKPVTVNSSPIAALQLVKAIAQRDNVEVHFSNVESRMMALETAEDVAAFAFEGDDMDEARKLVNKAYEMAREILQGKINAKAALLNKAA
jgi:hypothetical protein